MTLHEPLLPRDPNLPLNMLVIGRVSTVHQNKENIEAGYKYSKDFIKQYYDGPLNIKELGEQCSGMIVERETIMEAIDEINSGKWDVVLMEDVSKSYRNPRWILAFVQDCVDDGVRVIAPGDSLDTADPNWELMLGAAAFRHGMHIPDTRRRVRRTALDSFHKGGMVLRIRAFYRKLNAEEAASGKFGPAGLRIAKLAEWTPTVQEMRRRVLAGETYEAIADWLTAEGVPTGEYVTGDVWQGRLVADLLRDPILCGKRQFKKTNYIPIFRTGKHRRKKNRNPEKSDYECLAHMSVEEFAELVAYMDERPEGFGPPAGDKSRLKGRPRAHSLWPAQHATCGSCGAPVHQMGSKILKCSLAFAKGDACCWCHVQSNPETIRAKLLPVLLARLSEYPTFREILIEAAWTEYQSVLQNARDRNLGLSHRIKKLKEEEANLTTAIREGGGSIPSIVADLKRVGEELAELQERRRTPDDDALDELNCRDALVANLDEKVVELARTSIPFGNVLRECTSLSIGPVQALDTKQVRPRAKLSVSLSSDDGTSIEFEISEDLFEPPLHIKHAAECARVKAANPDWTLTQIGDSIGVAKMTVKRALAYAKLMAEQETSEPYRELHEKPSDASRWKKRAS